MATLSYKIQIDGLEEDTFVVRGFDGHESISDSQFKGEPCYGFRYMVQLASRQSNIIADQVVDRGAELTLYRNGELVQRVNGIVRSFSNGDIGHNFSFYDLTLVPSLERLSLRHNSRIFQQLTVPEIISVLLQEMKITAFAFSVARDCAKREFCVQYRETDLEFLHRIAAEEGLVYSFEHTEGKHTILFTDKTESFPWVSESVPYNVLSGGAVDTQYVSSLVAKTQSEVSSVEQRDYSFKKPTYTFAQSSAATDAQYQQSDYEHYDAPGRYKDDVSGKAFNDIRLAYLRRDAKTLSGKSNHMSLRAGYQFSLEEHLNDELNTDYLVVGVSHQGEQPQALEEEAGSGATTYANQFKLIPATSLWEAVPQPKPQVDGPMIAIVVGPDDEEIFCDEYGRVKLHFPWDRYSNTDELSSCWVRVAQDWAGSQYGMVAIPRIGHEVIVSFLNGDPDQPIVTGGTYHETNTPPYVLPDNKTKTVIRTETHQGDGYNELSFEDQAEQEQIFLHAQKDYEGITENDHNRQIHNNKNLTVDANHYTQVKKNVHETIKGEKREAVNKNRAFIIDGNLHVKTGKVWVNDTTTEVHIKAGQKVVIESGSEITVSAGGSFVKVDPSGVHLSGAGINLNSGGSAGSGTAISALASLLPGGLEAPLPPEELIIAPTAAYMTSLLPALAKLDLPVAELCQKQLDGTCPKSNCECVNNG
ncbi:type VI secretion system tip protein VgrG [Vibrio sp. CAIM 722]|uniref:Type VI secretion system tip protein VgrG n=1 Tax=Vibrio eleionomae TaxID=2653505 RepID=A0A7X4LNW9_9VIBR|nr:type VI secretion system tip protein TssI/VgrG [Vibrio eleionomae]MZI95428.1 type VI secretion system tip protein VgrG [Vibrio eleionomae]